MDVPLQDTVEGGVAGELLVGHIVICSIALEEIHIIWDYIQSNVPGPIRGKHEPGLRPSATAKRCNSESRALSRSHPAFPRFAMSPDTRPPKYSSGAPPPAPLLSLEDFRSAEGRENRERRLWALWDRLPPLPQPRSHHPGSVHCRPLGPNGITYERAETLRAMYDDELLVLCKGSKDRVKAQRVSWEEFKRYAKVKEAGRLFCVTPSNS